MFATKEEKNPVWLKKYGVGLPPAEMAKCQTYVNHNSIATHCAVIRVDCSKESIPNITLFKNTTRGHQFPPFDVKCTKESPTECAILATRK